MHQESPTVYRLPVHLKDEQMVFFHADDEAEDVADRAEGKDTKLMAWFKANQTLPGAPDCLYYQDFPQRFVWVEKTRKWKV